MSCEHCTMREVKSGNVVYTEGEPYEDPPYHKAVIEQDMGFVLNVEQFGWHDGETESAYIKIRYCPWCGDELKAVTA